ncbi:FAD-dependent oxidoreductase [Microbacterium sp. C7(2022)]|uniref:FAD-dependent oxidoreductase n=1 Tax=Microbacterium sp. C7(2022) TaxID=2992759 RepID=UPI00237BD385|nr:FAD-dependent oxidoreductase [Microbacterium sp. C7(2022)]MDE0546217.1 FAD-dependent oxidoreductase [Microbacterium sp. C7(2022)]
MENLQSHAATKRIVVVGGVAGGMSCAARARRLDENAEIIVLERGEHVSFANCGLPYFVGGEIADPAALLVQTPASLRAALALDVRTGHDVIGLDAATKTLTVRTAGGDQHIEYDALVLSPGAAAFVPPIPGIDSPRVRTLRTVRDATDLRDMLTAGSRRAVVLGAGFIGIEAAEALAAEGLDVTVVEMAPQPLPPVEAELAWLVSQELARLGIDVRVGVAAASIEHHDDHDVVVLADGARVDADLVVLSVGVRPDTSVFETGGVECERGAIVVDAHGRTSVPGIWAVGDATISVDAATGARRPVALAGPANRAGRLVADDIIRPESAREIPHAVGTAIVRVGELTVALTGANRRALAEAGIDHRTLHLHANQHAGYFPGASQVHLVVHIAPETGLLLGAQAVGLDGVDKRIDVLATAIRAGMTVDELIDLDLAYSPPYGAAKDAVNMTGMVGENVLGGTLALWYAAALDDVLATSLVLDVRRDDEWVTGHVPGALHIPHTQLRERLDEVRAQAAGRPVRVMCASGVRSAIAHRILTQAGIDSASLSGGMLTLRATLGARAGDVLVTPDLSAQKELQNV